MRPLEITRAGVLGTVAVLVVAAVCVRLGIWQLHRREGRLAHNAVVAARMSADPMEVTEAIRDTTGLTYRRAIIEGEYDGDRTIVLAGRSYREMPGVHVYSPLRLAGGAVLVNRGWAPAADAATVDMAGFRLRGPIRVEGILMPFPDIHVEVQESGFRTRWFRLAGDAIRRQYPYPVAPLYLLATSPPPTPASGQAGASSGAERRLPIRADPPELTGGPHLSYAIQWFSFATIFIVGWIALLLRGSREAPGGGGAGTLRPGGDRRPHD